MGKNILEIVFGNAMPRIIRREKGNVDAVDKKSSHQVRFQPLNQNLDCSQKSAIQLCLDCVDVGIIHGPPGYWENNRSRGICDSEVARGNRVLVCSASSVAVDNVTRRLSAYLYFERRRFLWKIIGGKDDVSGRRKRRDG